MALLKPEIMTLLTQNPSFSSEIQKKIAIYDALQETHASQ
jgi:hypothetical protein